MEHITQLFFINAIYSSSIPGQFHGFTKGTVGCIAIMHYHIYFSQENCIPLATYMMMCSLK